MARDGIKIEVGVGLTVDNETARRCCRILSMYLTDNPKKILNVVEIEDTDTDGVFPSRYVQIIEKRNESEE